MVLIYGLLTAFCFTSMVVMIWFFDRLKGK
jgi:hypothetical protein